MCKIWFESIRLLRLCACVKNRVDRQGSNVDALKKYTIADTAVHDLLLES